LSLVFREGRPEDVAAVARLGAHSFPAVGRSLPEWEENLSDSPLGGVETLWVGADGGEIVAACRLYRFQQWIAGATIPIMGLGTVAISPIARRRGIAGRMAVAAFRQSRARGDYASALYPFRTSFYRNLGYGLAGEVLQFRIPPSALPDHPGRSRVTLMRTDDDRAAAETVYDRWAPCQTGQLVRSRRAWELVWDGEGRHGALYRDETGEPAGYAAFRYDAAGDRGVRGLHVEEIAWLDREARLALYGWLASLGDQWDHLLYRAHPDESFSEYLSELRFPAEDVARWHFWFPAAHALYGPMFRLLDVRRAWIARPVEPGNFALALEVHDTHLPDNGGVWTLRMEAGRVCVEKGSRDRADLRMQADIETLSRIYIGAISPSVAVSAGLATVDRAELLPNLDLLVRVPRPWTFDRF
jgi:predicted acetyltransferase